MLSMYDKIRIETGIRYLNMTDAEKTELIKVCDEKPEITFAIGDVFCFLNGLHDLFYDIRKQLKDYPVLVDFLDRYNQKIFEKNKENAA